jgi:hypothetical protein
MSDSLWTKPYLKETSLSIYKVMYDLFFRIPRIEVYQKTSVYLFQAIVTSANMDVMNEIVDSIYAEDVIPDFSNAVTPAIKEKINDFT